MPIVRTTPVSGVSFLVLSGVLWGTGGLLGRMLADTTGLSSFAVATYRLGIGGLLIVGYLRVSGRPLPRSRAAWRRIAVTAGLAALFQAAYFTAVTLTSVSLATLVTIGSSPVLVLLARRRSAGRRQVTGVVLAMLGLAMLVGLPAGHGTTPAGHALIAVAFAVLAAAGFSAMTLIAERPVPDLDDAATAGLAFTIGGALLVPVTLATSGLSFVPDARSVGLLLALCLVPTAVAYTCYFRGLRTAPAALGALMALLEPLTAAVLAAVLLGDRLGGSGIAGALLLGAAVVLAGAGSRNRAEPQRGGA
ncbi:DMT family transporter [Pseudonocardia alaniniphila]|uniref:DMT family transporter n=1 Tax=Pseudonocardia alaniniphila TaxID=75291 RepID=A0ABS9TI58_9PSEU|nr:DMT family transporter [Pseudonocardia alaniniphila]MCH6168230.1 DMT family transporter [Pseudonocardia alaniniphila]